ncbi:unnamed protein product [Cochlearia groenlandica]
MVRNNGFGQIMKDSGKPSFFKILRKDNLISELMRMIPPHIIRSISKNEFSYKLVLKVPWGSSWPVKINKNPSFYYMEDHGWNQFLEDNALGENEYLTFTHEENMFFNVNIYEVHGIEILKPRKSVTTASASTFDVNKGEERKKIYKYVKEEDLEGKLKQKVNLGKKKAEETEKSKKKTKVDTFCNDSEAETSSHVPEFSITIKKSHLLFLGVPKKFVDEHMPKKTEMFKIHHLEGTKKKSWEVLYLVTDVQSRFSARWSRLVKDLGLVVGDVCTFKLIKPTEMLVQVSNDDVSED